MKTKIMNLRLLLLAVLALPLLFSCAEDRPGPQVLKTSEQNIHFSGRPGAWMLTVNSNTSWTVENETDWCRVNKSGGINTEQLIVKVDSNDSGATRSATLRLASELQEVSISVVQDTLSGEYHYELPVVFHIIYEKEHDADTSQNIKAEVIYQMIESCNALYGNGNNSIDMNLKLVPATQTPAGKAMTEPGIDRVQNTILAYKDADAFLKEENDETIALMWDPNKYVNVYVFTCTRNDLLGVSHLALTPRQNSLIGLEANNLYFTQLPAFPWGIVINNKFIYEEDAYTTLAHELGHYLGLFHVFAETDCYTETDYCEDTPSYNRTDYMASLEAKEMTEQELYQRTSCDGVTFTSYNIMDYDYSYMNQFTGDQYLRVRHVLENSPLVPGPKNIAVTKSLHETEKPVIRTMEYVLRQPANLFLRK